MIVLMMIRLNIVKMFGIFVMIKLNQTHSFFQSFSFHRVFLILPALFPGLVRARLSRVPAHRVAGEQLPVCVSALAAQGAANVQLGCATTLAQSGSEFAFPSHNYHASRRLNSTSTFLC